MSMALLVGFIIAYPMNWWLVANHLKHGMMTVRPTAQLASMAGPGGGMGGMADGVGSAMGGGMGEMAHAAPGMTMGGSQPTRPPVPVMTLVSFLVLVVSVALAFLLRRS